MPDSCANALAPTTALLGCTGYPVMVDTSLLAGTICVASMPGATPIVKLANAAALVGTTVYVIGFIASWWLPEPKAEDLPE